MALGSRRAVTLIELILVMVIVAIGGAVAYPKVQQGIENQQAKKALDTLRTISQAVRLYEVDKGELPPTGKLGSIRQPPPFNSEARVLLTGGYIKRREFAPFYEYKINTDVNPPIIRADGLTANRIIRLTQSTVKGQDGLVRDSAGFLGPPS